VAVGPLRGTIMTENGFLFTPQIEEENSLSQHLLKCFGHASTSVRWWWVLTTDREFLLSHVSRRDLWTILLAVPGLLAMFADAPTVTLIVLDISVAFVLIGASLLLPVQIVWSDIAIAAIQMAHISAHSFCAQKGDKGAPSFESIQVLAVLMMASAGIHTVALVGFLAVSVGASPFLATSWKLEPVVACAYVLCLSSITEWRAARLIAERPGGGYKEVSLHAAHRDKHLFSHFRRAEVDGPETVSEGEERSRSEWSRSTITDYMRIFTMSNSHSYSQSPSQLASPMFTGRNPGTPQPQRFLASQVRQPGAAIHQAPYFPDPSDSAYLSQKQRFVASQARKPGAAFHDAPQFPQSAASSCSSPATSVGQSPGLAQAIARMGITMGTRSNETAGSEHPESISSGITDSARFIDTVPSPPVQAPPAPQQAKVYRGVKLGGFNRRELNDLFVEKTQAAFEVNGCPSYWTASGDYFLYYSRSTRTWGVGKAKRFEDVKMQKNNGIAHSPQLCDLWSEQPTRGWTEWDSSNGKWVMRPGSGVESRGKVRPLPQNSPKENAEVQTEYEQASKQTQTEPNPDDIKH